MRSANVSKLYCNLTSKPAAFWINPPKMAALPAMSRRDNGSLPTSCRNHRWRASAAASGSTSCSQQIGEGGMGVVFMAEQQQPVRRMVALKVIKAGMDSAQVIARFEAERQALALMDHPNIAKVLEAGTTSSGRPYFVMELVKGIPITKYLRRAKTVAAATTGTVRAGVPGLQHAHQKGIIHRDIKPVMC